MDHQSHHSGAHTAPTSPESKGNSPSGGNSDFKPKLRVVERGSQACNECRRHKIRCHPAPDDPEHHKPCARCVRMSLECVFKKHNRGRKRKNPPQSAEGFSETASKDMFSDSAAKAHHDAHSHAHGRRGGMPPPPGGYWNRGGSPERALMSSVGRYPFMAVEPQGADVGPGPAGPSRLAPHHSMPASSSLRSMVHADPWDGEEDDDTYSEASVSRPAPSMRTEPPRDIERSPRSEFHRELRPGSSGTQLGAISGGHQGDDPVSLGYLTIDEAKTLFSLFMKQFNSAMSIVDPILHTHDVVRQQSSFLYTVILMIASRYMDQVGQQPQPLSHNTIHQQIVILARDHLMWSFAEAVSTVDVVQAVIAMSLWKEPDDDKATFYFNRAVILAKELNLGHVPSQSQIDRMSEVERRELRVRQRVWMSLFQTNSIFHMQFRQPMLIPPTDPLIATSTFWLKQALPENMLSDTFVAFSVDLRRRFLYYRELLTEGPPPCALNLSVLTKTMNKEWDVMSEAWIRELIDVGGTPTYMHKPRVWYSSLALNLNLMILNQMLRIPPSERIPPAPPALGFGTAGQMRSIPAFHHCLNAASTALLRFNDMDKTQLTYASDTMLHFALYAATFLWTLCRTPELYDFDTAEVDYTRELILNVADALDTASGYPHSSPALHAKYLRRLVRMHRGGSSYDDTPGEPRVAADREGLMPPAQGFENQYGAPIPAPGQTPATAMSELDYLLGDFPWAGVEMPWAQPGPAPQVDPALYGPGGQPHPSAPHPPQDGYANGARRPPSPIPHPHV